MHPFHRAFWFDFFFFVPEVDKLWQNPQPQPHWLRKQTGVFAKHPSPVVVSAQHQTSKGKVQTKPKLFLDLSPM